MRRWIPAIENEFQSPHGDFGVLNVRSVSKKGSVEMVFQSPHGDFGVLNVT